MKKILQKCYALALMLMLFSCYAFAEDNQQLWKVNVDNTTKQNITFIAKSSDLFTEDDILQVHKSGLQSGGADISDSGVIISPGAIGDTILDIWFMQNDDETLTSMQIVLFLKPSKSLLCKVAIITQTQNKRARILYVISNDLNCKTKWDNNWYSTEGNLKLAPISITLYEIHERQ